jgi:hypothetical protein
MSNLAQYRLSLGLFSIGLLWLVSEGVGEDRKPGPLDSATKSIAHRLQASHGAATDQTDANYELAVSEAVPAAPEQSAPPRSAWAISPGGASEDTGLADDGAAPADVEAGAPLPADVGIIHK